MDTLFRLLGTNSLLLQDTDSVTEDRTRCFAGNRHHHGTVDVRYAGYGVNKPVFSITISVLSLLDSGF